MSSRYTTLAGAVPKRVLQTTPNTSPGRKKPRVDSDRDDDEIMDEAFIPSESTQSKIQKYRNSLAREGGASESDTDESSPDELKSVGESSSIKRNATQGRAPKLLVRGDDSESDTDESSTDEPKGLGSSSRPVKITHPTSATDENKNLDGHARTPQNHLKDSSFWEERMSRLEAFSRAEHVDSELIKEFKRVLEEVIDFDVRAPQYLLEKYATLHERTSKLVAKFERVEGLKRELEEEINPMIELIKLAEQ